MYVDGSLTSVIIRSYKTLKRATELTVFAFSSIKLGLESHVEIQILGLCLREGNRHLHLVTTKNLKKKKEVFAAYMKCSIYGQFSSSTTVSCVAGFSKIFQ